MLPNKWYLGLFDKTALYGGTIYLSIFLDRLFKKHIFSSDNLKLNLYQCANYVEELDFNDTVSMSP